jgi:2-keto-4-pentenoate hydratase/2-oxohepta-3-ene-1,7-dioic acid hydratase in catechol pathway
MKLVSFEYNGEKSFGVVDGNGIVDLKIALGGRYGSLKTLIAVGAWDEARRASVAGVARLNLNAVRLLPVVPDPDKIICIGINYDEHRVEGNRAKTSYPIIFSRFTNTQIAHLEPIIRPAVSEQLDFEGELAVVIGKAGYRIPRAQALQHVAGYSCYNDASVRDWQFHTHQYLPGKNFRATGPFGPWMVTADEISDPQQLMLTTRLNGMEVQRSGTDMMIFPVAELIEYISSFTELVPGDVILTGTPGGVGLRREPKLFMRDGDVVEVEISGIGVLRNPVRDEELKS